MVLASNGYAVSPGEDSTLCLWNGDTQLLSRWQVSVDGAELTQRGSDWDWIEQPPVRRNEVPGFVARHQVSVNPHGMVHRVTLRSLVRRDQHIAVTALVESQMADQFSLRLDNSRFPAYSHRVSTDITPMGMRFRAVGERAGFPQWRRECRIESSLAPRVSLDEDAARLGWQVDLPAGQMSELCISVRDPEATLPGVRDHGGSTYVKDLEGLLIAMPQGRVVPAAGAPWFLTLFGRDSLIAAYLARSSFPDLIEDVIVSLARWQGTEECETRQEEPGKIPHEIRHGEFAQLDLVPYARYYGAVDTTPLWLAMLAECRPKTIRQLEGKARAALDWISEGLERTGYVRYEPDEHGLVHQGWKDSRDAVRVTNVDAGIALVEVQGYTYWALSRAASMARHHWGDAALARDCAAKAKELKERFDSDFWVDGYPAQAFTDHAVGDVTSNPGHLLMTGILDEDQARVVIDRLMAKDMFTGFGLRTLSSEAPGYSPGSYHRGSVWPHDTAVAMVGMTELGHLAEAHCLADGLLALGSQLGGHLPEYVLGLGRDEFPPVRLRQAGWPQAWAAAAGVAAEQLREGANRE